MRPPSYGMKGTVMPESPENAPLGKKQLLTKALALLISAAALYPLYLIWPPVISDFEYESPREYIFLFIFSIPMTLLAFYFLHSAWILWKGLSPKGIHRLCVCLAWIFAGLLITLVAQLIEASLHDFSTPLIIIAAGLFYLMAKRYLSKWLSVHGQMEYSNRARAAKLYFGFLALFLWQALSTLTNLLPKHPDYEYLPKYDWLVGLVYLGSIIVAFLFYQAGVKMFLKKPPEEEYNFEVK